MTKRELFQLLKLISVYYDSFELQQEKVNEWYCILQEETLQRMEGNLRNHVARSPYPPRVSELVCKPDNGSRVIPNGEETKILLTSGGKPASKEVVERSLAEIRKVLGIKKEEV